MSLPAPETAPASSHRWLSSDVLRIVALAFGFYLLLEFLWITKSLLIVTALGVIFGLALSSGVDMLVRRVPMRRGIAAVLIVLALLAVLVGLGSALAPTLRDQSLELKRQLPSVLDRVEGWFAANGNEIATLMKSDPEGASQQVPDDSPAAGSAASEKASERQAVGTLREQLSRQIGGILGLLFPFVSGTVAALGALVLIIFISIYIAADPRLYKRGLMHLFPHRARPRADEVLTEIGTALRRWLIARLIAMVVVGLVATGALMMIGVKSAVALGVLAGLLEFIPFFGPIIAAVPAIGLGFAESPEKALYVAIAFLLINQLEGNVLTPLLLQNRVHVPPALTVVAVAALGILFGFLGLLIGEPLLVAVMVAIKMLYVEDVVGDEVT